jgi:hypothetical protein
VSITRRLRRPAGLCAIACALLMPAVSGAAVPKADPLAPERYYMSHETPPTAEERYYASFGGPAPVPRDEPDQAPWLPIALSLAGALSLVAVSATQLRRVRVRRGGVAVSRRGAA